MSSAGTEYLFKITDYTPQTMPFGRLIKYYVELEKIFGDHDGVHLVDIIESSHGSGFAVDRDYESQFERRIAQIRDRTAPKTALRAHDTINAMLREDKTSGSLADRRGGNVIEFPGSKVSDTSVFRIRDAATFTGELYHIAGVVFCTTTKDIAKSLRDFLFESVRVSGRGTWVRAADGPWQIDDFTIADFAPVKKESLRAAVNRLRAMDIRWPDDPIGEIRLLNEEGGRIQ